jgi:hypothetical protein
MIIEFKNGACPDTRSAFSAPQVSRPGKAPNALSFILLFLLCIGALAPTGAWGQFDSASVLGTIKDPSGAAVSSATVDLLNIAKGVKVTRQTDGNGDYEFTNVQPGEYMVTVAAAGFDNAQTDRFTVTVGARQRVELMLKVGTASQSVTVAGAATLLETDTSDRGETVGTEEAVNLPLNGRAYADLSVLVPGVRQSLLGTALSAPPRDASYNVNGLNSMTNNFQLDGIDNNAYQTANQGFSNEAVIPSPDAVQEFKVETDNYSAEYGRAGGAIINATIRSGTNQIHGVAYDYLRNTVLNAYGPVIGTGVKPTLVQNQFGGAFGGPIKRDKIFYFADFEGLRNVNRAIQNATVPTASAAQGIFTDSNGNPIPLQNPITGAQYTNGIIPVSDQSPFAAKVLSILQQDAPVTGPGPGGTFVSTPANTVVGDKGDGRVDYFINPRSTAFGRYSQSSLVTFLAPNIPGLAGGNANGTLYAYTRQIAGGYNYTPTTNSILELRLGLTWTESGKSPVNIGAESLLGDFNIPNIPTAASVSGGLNSQAVTGFSQFGRQGTNPQFTDPYDANPKVNYSILKGRNSFKMGGEYGYFNMSISDFHPQDGEDFYASQFSRATAAAATDSVHIQAYNLADFLVGARNSYQLNNLATIQYERRWYMGYFQDDYKFNSKLSFNLGARYELVTPPWENNNHLANFNPTTDTLVQASGGSQYNRSLINTDKKDLAPRFGFAYQVDSKTVVRGGYGIGFLHYFRFGGESTLGYNGPNIVDATINQTPPNSVASGTNGQQLCNSLTENPATCFRTTQSGYETNFATPQNFSTLEAQTRYVQANFPAGYVQAFHLTVQREIMHNTTFEASYVGSHGLRIPILTDFNQGATEPVSCDTGVGCLSQQARRPIATFTNILTTLPQGYLDYSSLQTKLERRYSNGLYLLNSFTWSKTINNASADLETFGGDGALVNKYNPAGDRGVSSYNQPLNDTLTFIADVPFGKGRMWGQSAPAWQQATLGGWEVTAINTVTSGLPINLEYTPNGQYVVSSTSEVYSVRPNLVSTAQAVYNPKSSWQKTKSGLLNTLNPGQVTVPTPSQYFGTAGRNDLRGPAFGQLNLALHKSQQLWSESSKIEFRIEAFNVLNATNYQYPDSTRTDSTFGEYTAANAYPARQVQMALRLSF